MTHYPKEKVEELLQPFKVEYFEEEEHHGETAIGEQKYWHIFHIVACNTNSRKCDNTFVN